MKKRLLICVLSVMCVVFFCGASSQNVLKEVSAKTVEKKSAYNFKITEATGTVNVCDTEKNFSHNMSDAYLRYGTNIREGQVVTVSEGSSCVVRMSASSTAYLVVPENTKFTIVTPEPTWIQRVLGIEPKSRIEIIEQGTGEFYYGKVSDAPTPSGSGIRG